MVEEVRSEFGIPFGYEIPGLPSPLLAIIRPPTFGDPDLKWNTRSKNVEQFTGHFPC